MNNYPDERNASGIFIEKKTKNCWTNDFALRPTVKFDGRKFVIPLLLQTYLFALSSSVEIIMLIAFLTSSLSTAVCEITESRECKSVSPF